MDVADYSCLKRFNCNYLQSSVSDQGKIAIIDQQLIKIFHYNYQTTRLTFLNSFSISTSTLSSNAVKIRDILWLPSTLGKGTVSSTDLYLCYYTDEILEIYEKTFHLYKRFSFPRTQITSMTWKHDHIGQLEEIYLISTSNILKLSLNDDSITSILSQSLGSVSLLNLNANELIYSTSNSGSISIRSLTQTFPTQNISVINHSPSASSTPSVSSYALRGLSQCGDMLIVTSEQDIQIQNFVSTSSFSSTSQHNYKSKISIHSTSTSTEEFTLLTTPQSHSQSRISIISSTSEEISAGESKERVQISTLTSKKKEPVKRGLFPHALPESGHTIQEILTVSPSSTSLSIEENNRNVDIMSSLFSISEECQDIPPKDDPQDHPSLLTILTRQQSDHLFQVTASCRLSYTLSNKISTFLTRPDVIASFLMKPSSSSSSSSSYSQLWIAIGSSASHIVLIYSFPIPISSSSCLDLSSSSKDPQIYQLPPQSRCKGLFIQQSPTSTDELHLFILSGTSCDSSLTSVSSFINYQTTLHTIILSSTAAKPLASVPPPPPPPPAPPTNLHELFLAIGELRAVVESGFSSIESRLQKQELSIQEIKQTLNEIKLK